MTGLKMEGIFLKRGILNHMNHSTPSSGVATLEKGQ